MSVEVLWSSASTCILACSSCVLVGVREGGKEGREVRFPHCSEKLLENVGENMSLFICFAWASGIDICCFFANNTSYEPKAANVWYGEWTHDERSRLHQTFMRLERLFLQCKMSHSDCGRCDDGVSLITQQHDVQLFLGLKQYTRLILMHWILTIL